MGTGSSLPGHEADHSLPASAEVKECASIHPLLHMSSWRRAKLIKHRDNLTFCNNVDLASGRNEYQEYSWGLRAAGK
jgi:hypothetical protein